MHWRIADPCRLVALLLTVVFSACTGGLVTQDGSPVVGSTVEIKTCDSVGGAYATTTNSGGGFRFNPFSPSSDEVDSSKYIPAGPIAIWITGDSGSMLVRRQHQYDAECPLGFSGSIQNLPCTTHVVDLVPMSLPDFLEEAVAFYEEDCGLAAATASALAATALDGRGGGGSSIPGAVGLADPGGAQASCITRCTYSCAGQPQADFQPCMCLCVESNCGVSFGPFCTFVAAEEPGR